MAKQGLNIAQVGAAIKQVCGKRMTQRVWANIVDAGAKSNIFFNQAAD